MVGKEVERRTGIVGLAPAFVGNPVRGQVDALLDGQEQLKERQVPVRTVTEKRLERPVKRRGAVVQPPASPAGLRCHDVTMGHQPPPP